MQTYIYQYIPTNNICIHYNRPKRLQQTFSRNSSKLEFGVFVDVELFLSLALSPSLFLYFFFSLSLFFLFFLSSFLTWSLCERLWSLFCVLGCFVVTVELQFIIWLHSFLWLLEISNSENFQIPDKKTKSNTMIKISLYKVILNL